MCFLEDLMQERLIQAVIRRVAQDSGRHPRSLNIYSRNAAGGVAAAMGALKRYVIEVGRGTEVRPDLLVIAIDGDCDGPEARRQQILDLIADLGAPPCVAIATPDPYVERWYLLDPGAIRRSIGHGPAARRVPPRCSHEVYKLLLEDTIVEAGAAPVLGGYEYADDIVSEMDLYRAGMVDPAFNRFIHDLRACIAALPA